MLEWKLLLGVNGGEGTSIIADEKVYFCNYSAVSPFLCPLTTKIKMLFRWLYELLMVLCWKHCHKGCVNPNELDTTFHIYITTTNLPSLNLSHESELIKMHYSDAVSRFKASRYKPKLISIFTMWLIFVFHFIAPLLDWRWQLFSRGVR